MTVNAELADVVEAVRHRLRSTPENPASLAMAVRAVLPWLGSSEVVEQARTLYADFYQLGVLTPLLSDPTITDILVNAPDEIWVVGSGAPKRTAIRFSDEAAVRTLATRLAAIAGRLLDDAHPYVDLEFDGLRVHALIPPLAVRGTAISIRRIQPERRLLTDLIVEPDALALVEQILRNRSNFLISGGTGSGKTTLLSALLRALEPQERVVIIEDTREIQIEPEGWHCLSLQTRTRNAEGRGEVSTRDLIRQSLRMRPDRIFVGEARGAEIVDLLAALNTGHAGSGGTVHARAIADVPARVEALAVFAGIPSAAAHSLLLSAIDVVIHLRSSRSGRGIESIGRLKRAGERAEIEIEYQSP